MGLWLKKSDGTVVEINTEGLAEAPEDGKQYARKDAAWAEVEATDIDDAPEDGKQYARQDAAWSEVEAAEVLRGDPNNPPADWATDQLLYDGIEDDGSGGGGGPHDHDNYLPLVGGAITGDLQVDGSATVGGKEVSVSGHLHSQYAPTHDHPYAASSHTHNYAAPHDHPYAASSHSHNYAPTHDHPYAASSHTHSYSPTSHTHDKVGGLGLAGVSVPPSGAQIVRSGTNGYTYLGWLNTVSGANTNEPTRIYTNSGGSDSFVRYMTPANFRKKVADFTDFCNPPIRSLNATTKNADTDYSHTFAATIGGVSLTNAKAVVAQVTVQAALPGYWTLWRYGGTRPGTSSGNYSADQVTSNQQVIPIDGSRRMKYRSSQKTSLFIIDVVAVMF